MPDPERTVENRVTSPQTRRPLTPDESFRIQAYFTATSRQGEILDTESGLIKRHASEVPQAGVFVIEDARQILVRKKRFPRAVTLFRALRSRLITASPVAGTSQ